jgi:hypothetical protein
MIAHLSVSDQAVWAQGAGSLRRGQAWLSPKLPLSGMDSVRAFCFLRRFLRSNPARISMPATPSNPTPTGDDRNLVAVDPTTASSFDDKLHLFWTRNRKVIYGLCVLALIGIIAKEGWEYLARQKKLGVQKDYAAATSPEQLKAFAVSHSDDTLGGIAQLRLADDAYKAGKAADALAGYEKAIASLKDGPLVARAQLGRALAKIQSGKGAEGQAELKKLVDDTKQFKAVRAEAGYHLTSLAVEAGNGADAQKYVDQLMQIDPASLWTQRAMMTRATLPAQPAPAAKDATPADTKQKKEEGAPSVQVKIPAK